MNSFLIHDLNEEIFNSALQWYQGSDIVDAIGNKNFCQGCLDCWTKNRYGCSYEKKYGSISELFAKYEQVDIVSSCLYGGYSIPVKSVIEKNISYSYPHFSLDYNSTHHVMKTDKIIKFNVIFYGNDITDEEKRIAINIVKNNVYSLNPENKMYFRVAFVEDIYDIKAEHMSIVEEKEM